MVDDLKILKVEYLSNSLLHHTQIVYFIFLDPQNEDKLKWKRTWKYQKWNISATTVWIVTCQFLVGN